MRKGNIHSAIPEHFSEEITETLVNAKGVRIQRILSDSHGSPESFWYDQVDGEFVLLLEGSAALRFEGEEECHVLRPGDWMDILPHERHRVEWTDPSRATVWLAVHYDGDDGGHED